MKLKNRLLASAFTATIASSMFATTALADSFDAVKAKLQSAMTADIRTEAETANP